MPALTIAQPAEKSRLDSMLAILPSSKEDTNKIKLLYNISFTYFTVNPDEGILFGEQARDLSEKLKWKKGNW